MPTPSEQTDAATHRLQRIIVQEVSLVDRAANKRRFLVVKRDEPMTNAKKPVAKEDAAAATANVADDTAAAGDGTPAAGSGAGMQQQVKEALTSGLADIAEKIVAIANQVDQAEVTDQPADPAVPTEIMTQITDCAKALSDLGAKFGAPAAAAGGEGVTAGANAGAPSDQTTPAPNPMGAGSAAKAEDGKEPTDAEKAAVKESEDEVAKKGLEVAKHTDLVTKSVAKRLGVNLEAAQVVVRKVGRRMAKKRLEQLGKAIDMLIGLMKELRYENEKRAAKQAPAATQKNAAPPAAAAPPTKDVESLIASTEQVLEIAKKANADLEKTRADLHAANAKIAKLEKTTAGSNVLPVEKSGDREAGGSVSWPMDMNQRTHSRPATAK